MYHRCVFDIRPLGFTWKTVDPFLFCVHHKDNYPTGNADLGPVASLEGRMLGNDFTLKDGWRMYHGRKVPGFPEHPHRGFETITVVLSGFVDHSDSYGAAGRYGNGDVQWMTAGTGLQHAEMFPLLHKDRDNPLELFQIWLNLPAEKKFADPHYKMLWAEDIPVIKQTDKTGRTSTIRLIAGALGDKAAPSPAPDSWAADADNKVAVWLVTLEPNAELSLPPENADVRRSIYFYEGDELSLCGLKLKHYHSAETAAERELIIKNGATPSKFLLLQGKPIAEPVVQHGPFVMNTATEIQDAFRDYRRTQFGGWPWENPDHVHEPDKGRFATYKDGRTEHPDRAEN